MPLGRVDARLFAASGEVSKLTCGCRYGIAPDLATDSGEKL
ncbi:hypothetical protein GPOL_c30070 [Gordonia polyisoprenivorans VH2]|uniref:Uncharacterized protein n=1 Tax=Gordonia polyisoprenivorans (strain DSM 44266 / VH2) TaxID=1112204 RepID=H6MUN8_GORPV|nr:hypothetical protein GPOL_c30070 [Gordonia polyisoprenivorans VH2]